jgi:hypothetical protein
MDDHWSRQRTINDVSALISRCSHLISSIDSMKVTLLHFSVYQFLSSDPQSFDGAVRTLPQYHCHPIFDAYMAIANTFGRSHRIDGAPELLRAKVGFITSFHSHPNFLPRVADLLTAMFNAPLVENMQQPSLVFPNATHVKAINCHFFSALDEYYIMTSQTSAEFLRGPYFWTDVFPQPFTECTLDSCHFVEAACGIHIQPDHRSRTRPAEDFLPTDQTHVTI